MPVTGIALPQSGVGGRVLIGGLELNVGNFDWYGDAKIMAAPNFPARQWMEYAVGKIVGGVTFAGVFSQSQNPWIAGIKLGQHVTAEFVLNNSTNASAPDAIVAHWRVYNDADGTPIAECSLVFNYIFGDFSGTPAG